MKKLSSALALILILVCLGCAITPAMLEKPIERERTYPVSFEKAWEAAMSVFVKSSGAVSTIDKQSGVIGLVNTMSKAEMDDFVAEKPPAFPIGSYFGQGQMYVNAIISKIDDSNTKVYLKTKIIGSLLNAYGYPLQFNISLTSNGKLEEEFFKKLSAELGLIQYDYLKVKQE